MTTVKQQSLTAIILDLEKQNSYAHDAQLNEIFDRLAEYAACEPANDHFPYAALRRVLDGAFHQAAYGKGAERHANNLSFTKQPMQTISTLLDSDIGMLFQAIKKIQEGSRFDDYARYERELLGAIVYIAGAILYRAKQGDKDVRRHD